MLGVNRARSAQRRPGQQGWHEKYAPPTICAETDRVSDALLNRYPRTGMRDSDEA